MNGPLKNFSWKHEAWFYVFPAAFYFLCFVVLTLPAIFRFSTHLYGSGGDVYQFYWNLWWLNKATTELHQSPWFTNYLFHPDGTSLLGHTLSPFNGYMSLPLLRFMSLIQTYNFAVIFAFVVGGLTAFHLCHHITRHYWASLAGGYLFTFCNYHFAHAEGHLNLTSLQFLPLFVLLFLRFLETPTPMIAFFAGVAMVLNMLCDNYYFLYCFLAGLVMCAWHCVRIRDPLHLIRQSRLVPLVIFVAVVMGGSGPLFFEILRQDRDDPILGGHPPDMLSVDLLQPILPGESSLFGFLTRPIWSKQVYNPEQSVYLGLTVIGLLIYAALRWRALKGTRISLWLSLMLVFGMLALGPYLQFARRSYPHIPLPYAVLETIFPILQISGVPVRMMIMVTLAASVLVAAAIKDMHARGGYYKKAVPFVLALLFVEYLPKPFGTVRPEVPGYVYFLRDVPDGGAAIDLDTDAGPSLYYQTIHERRLALGYITRVSRSSVSKSHWLQLILRESMQNGDFRLMAHHYGFRWLVIRAETPLPLDESKIVVYKDATHKIVDLWKAGELAR